MYEPLEENLIDEVTRLVGRPLPVVKEAVARLLAVLVAETGAAGTAELAVYPLTAWQALAPYHRPTRNLWSEALSAGLTTEEVFTTLAVLDDYARRRYGNEAWKTVSEWGPRLARQYQIDVSGHAARNRHGAETGLGATV